jgi:hypothetical protein
MNTCSAFFDRQTCSTLLNALAFSINPMSAIGTKQKGAAGFLIGASLGRIIAKKIPINTPRNREYAICFLPLLCGLSAGISTISNDSFEQYSVHAIETLMILFFKCVSPIKIPVHLVFVPLLACASGWLAHNSVTILGSNNALILGLIAKIVTTQFY